MKTSHLTALPAVATAMCGLLTLPILAQGNGNGNNGNGNGNGGNSSLPAMPAGWLSAYPTVVQTGTHPTLTWGINYPSLVQDFVTVTPPATVTAKEELDAEVRVLGNGVTAHNSVTGAFSAWVPVEAVISFNGGDYNPIFYGTNLNVNPNTVVWSKTKIRKNQTLRFGGRYHFNNNYGPLRTSSSGTQNVRTLVKGDLPPTTQPMHLAPSLEDFIRPYLDSSGRVNIGPMDVIVFMELTHTDAQMNEQGYDMQDLVLLVTFKAKAKTNNGHGNNIDGVDSSNPGNAPFINLDTDPNFDDEGGGGGAAPSQP